MKNQDQTNLERTHVLFKLTFQLYFFLAMQHTENIFLECNIGFDSRLHCVLILIAFWHVCICC